MKDMRRHINMLLKLQSKGIQYGIKTDLVRYKAWDVI